MLTQNCPGKSVLLTKYESNSKIFPFLVGRRHGQRHWSTQRWQDRRNHFDSSRIFKSWRMRLLPMPAGLANSSRHHDWVGLQFKVKVYNTCSVVDWKKYIKPKIWISEQIWPFFYLFSWHCIQVRIPVKNKKTIQNQNLLCVWFVLSFSDFLSSTVTD